MKENSNSNFITLQAAMDQEGATDQSQFISTAKRHKCYLKKGGIIRINISVLRERLDEEFAAAQEQIEHRSDSENSDGRSIGLIRARLTRFPRLIAAKEKLVKVLREEAQTAPTAYDRRRAREKAEKFESDIQRMQQRIKTDQKDLDSILNEDEALEEMLEEDVRKRMNDSDQLK